MADDLVQRLEELASLRAQGLVSEAEFTERKAALLAGGAPEAPIAPPPQSVGVQSPLDAFEPRKRGGFELAAPLEELEQLPRIGPNAEEDSGGTVVVPPIFEPLPGPPTADPPRVASYELPAAVLPPPPTPSPFVRASVAPSPPGRAGEPYPMVFEVEYPERLSRLTTFFRVVLILPAWVFLSLLGYMIVGAVFAGWTAVFWRKRYPSWLFAAASGYLAYGSRVGAYGALLTDRYPSFEPAESPVRLEYATPPDRQLSRWRVVFWKSVLILCLLLLNQ